METRKMKSGLTITDILAIFARCFTARSFPELRADSEARYVEHQGTRLILSHIFLKITLSSGDHSIEWTALLSSNKGPVGVRWVSL